MTERFTAFTVENATLGWLATTGWQIAQSPETVPGMPVSQLRVKDAGKFIERAMP
jgi:hypothetical protein